MKKILSVNRIDYNEKGIDLTKNYSGDQRVSMLEDLRQQVSKVTQHEYPRRLRRVLEIAHQTSG